MITDIVHTLNLDELCCHIMLTLMHGARAITDPNL